MKILIFNIFIFLNLFLIIKCDIADLVFPDGPTKTYAGLLVTAVKKISGGKSPSLSNVVDDIKKLQKTVSNIESTLDLKLDVILKSMDLLFAKQKVEDRRRDFYNYVAEINYQYNYLSNALNSTKLDEVSLHEFAKSTSDVANGNLMKSIRNLVQLIVPNSNNNDGFVNLYANNVQKMEQQNIWCDNEESLNTFIYKSFQLILHTLTEGYLTAVQACNIRESFNDGDFTSRKEDLQREYQSIVSKITDNLRNLSKNASTRIRRCDPPKQDRGRAYIEMEKLLQGIIVNKMTLNKENTNYYNCDYFKNQGADYYPYQGVRSDGNWKCNGKMYDCFTADSDKLCMPSTQNRRIDGFTAQVYGITGLPTSKRTQDMGNLTNCNNNKFWSNTDWNNPNIFTTYDTATCGCTCDDYLSDKSLRTFSGIPITTDITNNMVMTGIRLFVQSNSVHISVQQGQLKPYGVIEGQLQWKAITTGSNNDKKSVFSYNKRKVSLDTYNSPSNEVAIGAGFEWDDKSNSMQLVYYTTTFNFTTGVVDNAKKKNVPKTSSNNRRELTINGAQIPTLCNDNVPNRQENRFVQFQTTDWKKDAAQTTIPYVDIQQVVSNPPAPSGGLGLTFKNAGDCGGYIGLELYSLDTTNFIN